MSTVFLLCCFLFIASSDGAMTAKKGNADAIAVANKAKGHNAKLEVRQDDSACERQLQRSAPSFCNATYFQSLASYIFAFENLTDAQIAFFSRYYSQVCVPACIDPIETYYNCIPDSSRADIDFLITFIRKGICGQTGGDYCAVRYARQYKGDTSTNLAKLHDSCGSSSSSSFGISCTGASFTCLSHVSTFSSRMGCCTEPYLGSGVRSCSGVSVDAACTGVVSSAAVLVAPVFIMIFALIGFFA